MLRLGVDYLHDLLRGGNGILIGVIEVSEEIDGVIEHTCV